ARAARATRGGWLRGVAAANASARFLRTLAIAAGGVALFHALDLPLPFLLGPLAACLAAALAGASLEGPARGAYAMRTVLGLAAGASVTPAMVERLGDFLLSVALVPLFLVAAGAVGVPFFRRVCRFDAPTAYYAAMPGGLQDMVVFGTEAGGSARTLSLVHATRVGVLVAVLPAMLTLIWGRTLDALPGVPALTLPPDQALWMLVAAVAGTLAALRLGLFGAPILGPLAVAAGLSLGGVLAHRPPAEAILAAQFLIGTMLATAYVGITPDELRRTVLAALGYCAILALLSLVAAEIAHLAGVPGIDAALAFAPGGQAEMLVLALVVGADAAYVAAIHLWRLILVITGAPLVRAWIERRG
ncbi:MAG: AbrB family transcriptional regulator, partial [Pseudomonadota bacterium]